MAGETQNLIQKGILTGKLKKRATVKQIALSIISILEGGLKIRRITDDPLSMEFILDTIEKIKVKLKNKKIYPINDRSVIYGVNNSLYISIHTHLR